MELPPSLAERVSARDEHIQGRFKNWRYADRSLGEMLERIKTMPYYEDTLVVITSTTVIRVPQLDG